MKSFKIIAVLSLSILLTGCFSIKTSSEKSGGSLFETFYVGEAGTQYFIKPLTFYNLENKDLLQIDFTFRYKNEVKDSVTANISFKGSSMFRTIDSLSISNTSNKIICRDIKLLFNETNKSLFTSRFSTNFSLFEFNKMFDDNEWKIDVYQNETHIPYTSKKKTQKTIKKLQEKLFVIIQ